MNSTPNALEIHVDPVRDAFAEEWISLVVNVQTSDFWPSGVELRNIGSKNKSLQINLDLLDRQLVIRPGEAYRFTVPVRVPTRCTLSLDSIFLQVGQKGTKESELMPLPKIELKVRPSIGKEIDVRLETICQYDEGIKATLRIKHIGSTAFSNLTATISPDSAIWVGKPVIRRERFAIDDEENVDLVLTGQEITVNLAANVDSDTCEKSITLRVQPPSKLAESWYRFVEPCGQFDGEPEIHEVDSTNTLTSAVYPDQNSLWPLRGGLRYQVIIRPKHGGMVESISIPSIADMIVVRSGGEGVQDEKDGSWKFVIDVINHDLFCKSEVINYSVTTKGRKEIGEIPILLIPQPWKHWKVAGILGATMTLQGVTAIPKLFHHGDDPLHLFTDFKIEQDYNLLFLLTIPAFWLGLKITDWLLYRLQA